MRYSSHYHVDINTPDLDSIWESITCGEGEAHSGVALQQATMNNIFKKLDSTFQRIQSYQQFIFPAVTLQFPFIEYILSL